MTAVSAIAAPPVALELPRTGRVLERGIEQGLHLGAQLYVSRTTGSGGRRR